MSASSVEDEAIQRIARIREHLQHQVERDSAQRIAATALAEATDMQHAIANKRYGKALQHHALLHRMTVDNLSWSGSVINDVMVLTKQLKALQGDVRCPFCDGVMRTLSARKCPECLRSWTERTS